MLLISPIARYLLAELFSVVCGGRPHGTTQEAGYDVGQSGGRTISYQNSMLGSTFLWHVFVCGRFKLHTK